MTHPTVTQALSPCPFCGGDARFTERATARDEAGFFCAVSCFCGGYSAHAHQHGTGPTPESARSQAIAAWNTRATEASTAARIAALEAENGKLREVVQRAQAIIWASTYVNWHDAARAALTATEGEG